MTRPLIGLAVGICMFGAIATEAMSHGDYDWILQGRYKSSDGVICCTRHDCFQVHRENVRPMDGGRYAVIFEDETQVIEPGSVHRSPDGKYHACRYPKQQARCLFVPFTGV